MTDERETCHCGKPPYTHPDGFTRGLCYRCDLVRCDAYPGECDSNWFAEHVEGYR